MDILSEMSSIYYELTISEKRIAEYILEHTDEVQMMSVSELAEVCHVGEATITRFCKRFHSRASSRPKDRYASYLIFLHLSPILRHYITLCP